jgi:hypothetical protein
MDYYERHLLALAVEACKERNWALTIPKQNWIEAYDEHNTFRAYPGITALLADLGVTPPERPSAEAVQTWMRKHIFGGEVPLDELRADPLLAAAVLEAS